VALSFGVLGVFRPLVGVTEPSCQPPSIIRAMRVDGDTAFGDSGPFLARVIGGDTGVFGTVSRRLGLREDSGRFANPPTAGDCGGKGVGGDCAPANGGAGVGGDDMIGVGGDGASMWPGDGFFIGVDGCGAAIARRRQGAPLREPTPAVPQAYSRKP